MMFTISVMASKGGVGKTTLVANLGSILADMGCRVLLIDADVQNSLSKYYHLNNSAPQGLVEMIMSKSVTEHMISETVFNNLWLIQSNDGNNELQSMLSSKIDRAIRIRQALNSPFVHESFDFVIIDTQGSLGYLQDAAAFAADIILSPISPDALSAREFLSGTEKLLEQLKDGAAMGLPLPIIKAIINKMDNTRNAKDITAHVEKSFMRFQGRVSMMNTVIRSAKAYTEAMTAAKPVHCHEIQHAGKQDSAYLTMHKLVWELFPNMADTFCSCFGNVPVEELERLFLESKNSSDNAGAGVMESTVGSVNSQNSSALDGETNEQEIAAISTLEAK